MVSVGDPAVDPLARRFLRLLVLAAGVALVLVGVATLVAKASNSGSTFCTGSPRSCGNWAWNSNGNVAVGFFGVADGFKNAVVNRMTNAYTNTDLEFSNVGDSSPNIGVLVQTADIATTSFVGWVDCMYGLSGDLPEYALSIAGSLHQQSQS